MKTTYDYLGRQYSAYWNEKVYGTTCYVVVTALDTQSQQKVVFNAKNGTISYGNRTRDYARAALASIDAAPFNSFEFGPPPPTTPVVPVEPVSVVPVAPEVPPAREMSVKEAAKALGVSLSTVYRRIHTGKLQAQRVKQANGRLQYVIVLLEKAA